jgi:preprotein translocase subunit SecE
VKAKAPSAAIEKAKQAKPASGKAVVASAKTPEKAKEKTQPKKEGRIAVWWRETVGELRKVSWPTLPEARRMTVIVLIVMAVTAAVFGALDRIFSWLVGLLVQL